MSGLIKAGEAGMAVQPFGLRDAVLVGLASEEGESVFTPDRSPGDPSDLSRADLVSDRAEMLDRQCLELEATIAELRSHLANAESDITQREDAAFNKGQAEGLRLANLDEDRRIATLASAIDKMTQEHAVPLAECELLALQLSRAALSRLFFDPALHAELIEAAIAVQLERLGHDMFVRVAVSPLDFRSDEALARLTERFRGVEIGSDESLPAGGCSAQLRLGRIDLSLPSQWRNLCNYFDQLALEGAGT